MVFSFYLEGVTLNKVSFFYFLVLSDGNFLLV